MYITKKTLLRSSKACSTQIIHKRALRTTPSTHASQRLLPQRASEEALDTHHFKCTLPHIASHARKTIELIPCANQMKAICKRAPFAGFILQNNYVKMEEHYLTEELKRKRIEESPELEETFI